MFHGVSVRVPGVNGCGEGYGVGYIVDNDPCDGKSRDEDYGLSTCECGVGDSSVRGQWGTKGTTCTAVNVIEEETKRMQHASSVGEKGTGRSAAH